MQKKFILILSVSLGAAALTALLFLAGVLEGLEYKTLDARFHRFARQSEADTNIVIVAIDEESLREFKRNNIYWKWPRDLYAAMVSHISKGRPKAILFDILFPDPDIDRLSSDGWETDSIFAGAVRDAGTVLIAAQLNREESLIEEDNPLLDTLKWKPLAEKLPREFVYDFPAGILPLPEFQRSAAGVGCVNYYDDPQDGITRRLPLFYAYNGAPILHMGLLGFMSATGAETFTAENGRVSAAYADIPLDSKGRYLVSWYGKGGPAGGTFSYYSFVAVIHSFQQEMTGKPALLPSSAFKDKIVIVGASAASLFDLKNTPFSTNEAQYPGMEIYATVISNFLHGHHLIRSNALWILLVIVALSVVIAYAVIEFPRVWPGVSVAVAALVAWIAFCAVMFPAARVWVDLVAPVTAMVLSFTASAVARYQIEGKARRHLRSMFGRYLSPVVISEVVEKSESIELGGKTVHGTVFFSDLKDFTNISEKMLPHDLVTMLNEYFTFVSDIVMRHGGLLDKYLGDAVMAIYGAPVATGNHAADACRAALEIQNLFEPKFQPVAGEKILLQTRIGINSGPMVVGNIGSSRRLDYTAIGDTVNLSSRLEGVNKSYGTNIMVSESAREAAGAGSFVTRELDRIRVKGKDKAVTVYELVGVPGAVPSQRLMHIERFEEALAAYRAKKFDKARRQFRAMLKDYPADSASALYAARCDELKKNPPKGEWDGVYVFTTK